MIDYSLELIKVLLVEDNSNMRSMVKSVMHTLGVRDIVVAEDGDSAMRRLNQSDIDIVFCDWVMQPIDGPMLVKRIRRGKNSPNPFMPIIMLTAFSDEDRVIEARDIGVNEFLCKPISAKNLYSRIKAVIEDNRKFIKVENFFGPDRRRRDDKYYNGVERRVSLDETDNGKSEAEGE